jgi:hypothetical protein
LSVSLQATDRKITLPETELVIPFESVIF